jgi:hypothetical protein
VGVNRAAQCRSRRWDSHLGEGHKNSSELSPSPHTCSFIVASDKEALGQWIIGIRDNKSYFREMQRQNESVGDDVGMMSSLLVVNTHYLCQTDLRLFPSWTAGGS